MRKRNIALVMAGLLAAASLAGCSGGAKEEARPANGTAKTEAAASEAPAKEGSRRREEPDRCMVGQSGPQ